jgi:hypothetical protein
MDKREERRQQKEKAREQKNKVEKAYNDAQQQHRPPINAVWLIVLGTAVTAVIVYAWTVGLVRPW